MENNAEERRQMGESAFVKCANFQAEERHGYKEIVVSLVRNYKVDSNCSDSSAMTQLHMVCSDNCMYMAKYLLKDSKIDANCSEANGWTPLHWAAKYKLTQSLGNLRSPLPNHVHVQVNICHDVAQARIYLHSNGVIHRDLFVSNVLLMGNTLEAKVCDFGMARLLDLNPSHRQALAMCSGNPAYMPPEVLKDNPKYSEKLDCFSFGVCMLQILTRSFPQPGDRNEPLQDVRCAGTILMRLVPEVERRKNYIRVALGCLKDESFERPSVQQVYESIRALEERRLYRESEIFGNKSYPQLVFQAAMESYKQYLKCEETSAMIAALIEKINEIASFCVWRTALLQASAHQEKPTVNWKIRYKEVCILHLIHFFRTRKREAVGESDTNQEKPAINVTGEWSGHGTGCTYKLGKLKKGHIGESDANQENPAGHLIGEKSGHDGGPACDYGKQTKVCMDGSDAEEQKLAMSLTEVMSVCDGDPDNNHEKSTLKLNEKSVYSYEKVELSARYSLCSYLSSGWYILWIEFLFLCCVLISAANSVSLSNNLNGSTMACPGQQVRFVCLANSPELYWISPEYIGPPSVKIEFSRALDGVGRTILKTGIAAATLLSTNRSTVISSELVITASQDFPTASVTCGGGNDNVTTTFKVSSGPEIPHNVTASILSSSGDDCTILLRWDLPTDMTTHVFVDFANVTLKIPPQVTIAALPVEKCNLNATVGIRAVDICGRPGARAEVLKNVLHNSGNTATTAASETYNSICLLCDDSAMTWIITFSLVIGLVIVVITTIIAGISINMFTHAQNITGRHTDKLHTLVNYSHHHNFLKCAQDSERLLKKSD